jgi:hypothetical protein
MFMNLTVGGIAYALKNLGLKDRDKFTQATSAMSVSSANFPKFLTKSSTEVVE